MNEKAKLYHFTSSSFQLPSHLDASRNVVTMPAQSLPMLKWPNGRWCLAANAYILQLYRRGLSRRDRGGTLFSYATNLSHLVRFCFRNNVDFIDLTDTQFSFFIRSLQGERRPKDPMTYARDATSTIAIGRTCLEFLASVGRLYGEDNFVATDGQIRAQQKSASVRIQSNGRRRSSHKLFWHHHSFPTPDPRKRRLPVTGSVVAELRHAVASLGGSSFVRKRRYVMLTLLEATGARRSEIAAITVDSVRQAWAMAYPLLKVCTVKQRKDEAPHRLIPITRADLLMLVEFIEKNRPRVIRLTCGAQRDRGALLISEKTGHGLRANTITQEIDKLKRHAGIKEATSPHMFRHRFITKLFVSLIEAHSLSNADELRRALLDAETMKQKIQQWTGHKDVTSLNHYIHLAFDEVSGFQKTISVTNARQCIESFRAHLEELTAELRTGADPSLISKQIVELANSLHMTLHEPGSEGNPTRGQLILT